MIIIVIIYTGNILFCYPIFGDNMHMGDTVNVHMGDNVSYLTGLHYDLYMGDTISYAILCFSIVNTATDYILPL